MWTFPPAHVRLTRRKRHNEMTTIRHGIGWLLIGLGLVFVAVAMVPYAAAAVFIVAGQAVIDREIFDL
jgi:hypothetical protein